MDDVEETLEIKIHGAREQPTLIYLPGTHGDCTIITPLRHLLSPHCRFVEITYPRTTSWFLSDYARHITNALSSQGITEGWLLAESFGSQIAWPLANELAGGLKCRGIILAGGFGRHPFPWGVRLAIKGLKWLTAKDSRVNRAMQTYSRMVKACYETTADTEQAVQSFIERRNAADASAAIHRLHLIATNNPQESITRTQLMVFSLSGFWDALVPWYLVTPWLRRHCPRYKESALIYTADHNVLFSAPSKSARTILKWLGRDESKDS